LHYCFHCTSNYKKEAAKIYTISIHVLQSDAKNDMLCELNIPYEMVNSLFEIYASVAEMQWVFLCENNPVIPLTDTQGVFYDNLP